MSGSLISSDISALVHRVPVLSPPIGKEERVRERGVGREADRHVVMTT